MRATRAAADAGAGNRPRGGQWGAWALARFAAILILCLFPAATTPGASGPAFRIRYVTTGGVKYLYLEDIARYYGMKYEAGKGSVALRSRYSTLTFTVDRRECTLNGVRVHLSDAPLCQGDHAVLAEPDFRLLLEPTLRSKVLKRKAVRRVLVDPGHGGRDPGALGKTVTEESVTLRVAQRLVVELTRRGYAVALTRDRDVGVTLESRAAKAKSWRADILISLHCNAVGTPSVRGAECFRATPENTRSTYGSRKVDSRCTNNAWDLDNARLAYELQKSIVAGTGAEDRGLKSARFLVLKESPCPAALVEMGYLTHPEEERNLGSPKYQAKMAQAIAQAVARYDQCLKSR
ncbi:MAG: N-acetylmuramoyl-L-alanine amidase [Lentisphaeria bacterium]|nr:N-acetylmuramoyl-L-alanine amidase [Lentisphaeria bacterium]